LKKAVILHGTDGSPEGVWIPWLKTQLQTRGYEVWAPELPGKHTPNRQIYNDFLFNADWDFTDNLVIGHSSGAVSVLNLLLDDRCPHIANAVLVSAWADTEAAGLQDKGFEAEQFTELFPPGGFNFDRIKSQTDHILFFHGDDDRYCPLDQAQWLAQQAGSEIVVIPGGGHLGSQFPTFPQLTEALEARHRL